MELSKEHWQQALTGHENMILQGMLNIEMAEEMVKFCKKKISEFPDDKTKTKK